MYIYARDVDNYRIAVFSDPGMAISRQGFYPDTFRMEKGTHAITNYPDQYRLNAPYGGEAFFYFLVPINGDPILSISLWGRDTNIGYQTHLSQIPKFDMKYIKMQHWNDKHEYKTHAHFHLDIIADYQEVNFRYQCGWMESEQGFDYNQARTKEGLMNPKIPETLVWRKITENCNTLPNHFQNPELNLLSFIEVSPNQPLTNHNFKNENKEQKRVYIKDKENYEATKFPFELTNPFVAFSMKTDGSTPFFMNDKGEEIFKLEGIYEGDLQDKSFNPQYIK